MSRVTRQQQASVAALPAPRRIDLATLLVRGLVALDRDDLAEGNLSQRGTQVGGKPRRGLAHLGKGRLLVLETPAPVLASTDVHRAESTVTSL